MSTIETSGGGRRLTGRFSMAGPALARRKPRAKLPASRLAERPLQTAVMRTSAVNKLEPIQRELPNFFISKTRQQQHQQQQQPLLLRPIRRNEARPTRPRVRAG